MKLLSITFLAVLLSSFASINPLPTNAKINIVDELGNNVEGATVTLYNNKEDYRTEENPVQTGLTDQKGKVTLQL